MGSFVAFYRLSAWDNELLAIMQSVVRHLSSSLHYLILFQIVKLLLKYSFFRNTIVLGHIVSGIKDLQFIIKTFS
jgi:hypothetical protein